MNSRRETFKKTERLCSRKILTGLFENGSVLYYSYYKVVWSKIPGPGMHPAQTAFSVSKKGFRHAVTRNLIKRRMKEAYRKNKYILYDFLTAENIRVALIIVFKENTIPDYLPIEKSMNEMLVRLTDKIRKAENNC